MCGILGSVNLSFDKSVLDLIKHRGPDFGDLKQFSVAKNEVLLAHRRLSIVDLSPLGNQPFISEDNKYVIIFNGEIYNHQDLRKNLNDVDFKSQSDTETILYHLIEFGTEKLNELNGIFAFAFLDIDNQKLILARDPFGVKPLYYSISANQLIFSSEIRPIKKRINPNLDKDNLNELLKLRYNPSEGTLYKEINKISPGHFLEYDLNTNQHKIVSYFNKPLSPKKISFDKALHRYGELFEQAVKRQLMSDVEIGLLLSGGIDSALVAHFAVKNSPNQKIKSFTVGFDDLDDTSNELIEARESARIIGTEHHEIVINQNDFENNLEKVINIVEEPLATTSSIPMYFLNEEVGKHLKVVLSGQGADELLAGYPRYLGEVYRQKIPAFLPKLLSPIVPSIKNEKIRRFLSSAGENDIIKRFEKTYSLFSDAEINRLIGPSNSKVYNKIRYNYNLVSGQNLSPIEAMMSIDLRMNLSDDLLLYTDKVSMNFGLETRVPILDFELVEFIRELPTEFKIKNSQGKYIHKEFAKQVLSEEIVNRKKKGFLSPTQKWFNQNLGELIEKMVHDNSNQFHEIFDKKEVLNILKKHKSGFNQEKQLFLLISLYFWFKNLDT